MAAVKLSPELAIGYLRAATIFKKKNMSEPAFKICRIGLSKIDTKDEDRKALETLYMDLASKLGITLKRAKRKENISPPSSKRGKIEKDPLPNVDGTVAATDDPIETEVQTLPPPLPSIIHNFGTHSIPFEIIQEIFEYLPLKEITKCLRLSSQIRAMLSNNKFLWRDLDVSRHWSKVTDVTIASLLMRGRDQVRSIVLQNCSKVTKTGLKAIANSRSQLSLFELTFNRKVVPESIVSAIRSGSTESIRRLNLSGTGITDDCLAVLLEKCRTLEELVVSECAQLTDGALGPVIKTLLAHKQQLNDQPHGVKAGPIFSLKLLDLSGNTKLSDKLVCNAARCFPLLVSINLAKLEMATQRSLEAIALHCKNLESIDATGLTFNFIPQGGNTLSNSLLLIAKECTGLKSIRIAACKFVEDIAVNALTALCPNLEVIEFPTSANITNASLVKIGTRCKFLKRLNLSFCPQISDAGMVQFLQLQTEMNCLSSLDVSSNSRITDKTMESLKVYGYRKLQELNVSGCGVSGAGVLAFANAKREAQAQGLKDGIDAFGMDVWNMDRCSGVGNSAVASIRQMLPKCKVTANL
ncbi:hypothetical protein BDR26DRAFT_919081 [Obelidium mucronatum]|nr:hypothetical protein BDR26DRAFT_919081 [Obelidium mucronatum]